MPNEVKRGSNNRRVRYCSVCCKSEHEFRNLIGRPAVYICDQFVDLCDDNIRVEVHAKPQAAQRLPRP